MQSNTLADFIAYFRQLATEHVGLNDFVHGATERILNKNRSDINYPCLWLETPSLNLSETPGEITGWRDCAFAILQAVAMDDQEQQDQVWDQTETIALQVLARLMKDRKALLFGIDFSDVKLEPVNTLTVDNEYGWRVSFRMNKWVDLCYDPSYWATT